MDRNVVEVYYTDLEIEYKESVVKNIKGMHSRYHENCPWRRIPVISSFKLNKELGQSLILG